MQVDWRVRALDAVLRRGGFTITQARTVEEVQALRARRDLDVHGAVADLVTRAGQTVFGRPRPEVSTSERTLPGPAGPITVRLYRTAWTPPNAPMVVYFHGGGWVLGSLDGNDWICAELAADLGAVVASVDYRLAPESPAPAAVEDALAATTWLAANGEQLGATGKLAVAGDSAGGNLAALTAIGARDAGGPAIAAQVLYYPAVDLTMSFPSIAELGPTAPILRRPEMDAFLAHYLGADGDPSDPRLSPWAVEDVTGLPPALVQTAEQDPLRDEGRAYAERLRDAGVATRWSEYAGMPHGYVSLPGVCRSAPQAVAETVQFLREHLAIVSDG